MSDLQKYFESKRKDFPILSRQVRGHDLAYLDNAATTQKPQVVIQSIEKYYSEYNSNVHRGVHWLSEESTRHYESARKDIQKFIEAKSEREIVFTRGTTESINLVAQTYGLNNLNSGDEVLITEMEHHSNIVPWQIVCDQTGAKLKVVPVTDLGEIDLAQFENLLTPKVKIVAVCHGSNTLGTINPIKLIINRSRLVGAKILIDGAQAIQHLRVNVQDLDCDFYAFSGHKLYGPTGIGVLYGKEELLTQMPPYQGGGDMIRSVTFEKTTYNDLPYKFEAGTPNIEGAIGLGSAIKYINEIGLEKISAFEAELLKEATSRLLEIPEVKIIGESPEKTAVVSFLLKGVHAHDVGTILDQEGVAIRAGHHCTQPLMERFKVPATARASMAFYNSNRDIDALIRGIKKTLEIFK